jgi:hypothetical protein
LSSFYFINVKINQKKGAGDDKSNGNM